MDIILQRGINAYQHMQNEILIENMKQRTQTMQKDSKTSMEHFREQEDKRLREQTDNFEALFLQIMLKDAIKNENPLYPKQPGSDIYHSMYIENLANNLSGSFGYSELLFNYLKDLQNNAR